MSVWETLSLVDKETNLWTRACNTIHNTYLCHP